MKQKALIGLGSLSLVFTIIACSQFEFLYKRAKGFEADALGLDSFQALGDPAEGFLAKSFRPSLDDASSLLEALTVAQTDTSASLNLADGDNGAAPPNLSQGALNLFLHSQRSRLAFDSAEFVKVDETALGLNLGLNLDEDYTTDTVTWTHVQEEFVVSSLAKMPVRDQGRRGTCAAFSGVAQLEAFLIKAYSLAGIDLSEQRFYYMSKPENWSTGGSANQGGSNTGTGYAKSAGILYNGSTYPPDSPADFNIPLETACPYNLNLGTNDLQTPQTSDCYAGVAKVTDFAGWLHKSTLRVETAQQVFDSLATNDLPVIVFTRLSSNWERNDGMITLADAGVPGATSHSGGHAYLVVGARKISETDFPEEGGLCFIIRNSWGKGWGVDGNSCMTLAWFNAWRFSGGFPTLINADLDATQFENAQKDLDVIPSGLKDPDPYSKENSPVKSKTRRGTATLDLTDSTLLSNAMTPAAILANDGAHYRGLYANIDGVFFLRGILGGREQATHDVELTLTDGTLFHSETDVGSRAVGTLNTATQTITLCAKNYSSVCLLSYLAETNELVVQFTEAERTRKDSSGPYDWKGLSLVGYGLDFSSPPGLNTLIDVRVKVNGTPTNPLRFMVRPVGGDILFQGMSIGNYQSMSLCNGEYKNLCRLAVSGDDFFVLFKAKR